MKVTKKDLIGQIKGFPIEVVEKILERMEEQDTGDIKDLQCESEFACAFNWNETPEGWNFWKEVLWYRNWKQFFNKYPKKTKQSFIIKLFKRLFKCFS